MWSMNTMALQVSDFWSWRGTVGRANYFAIGALLFAFKHFIDRVIASAVFNLPWSLFNYWNVGESNDINNVPIDHLRFYATMVAIALPFIWTGLVLTIRRLRDIGWPLWLVFIFFVPFLNILLFLLLSTVPSRESALVIPENPGPRGFFDRVIPRSGFGSAVLGVAVTVLFTIGITSLGVYGLGQYGWGLFVGLPFFLGLSSVLIYGYHEPRSLGRCLLISLLSVGLASAALIALAIEGIICVFMAAPLGAAVALFGGAIGYVIQRAPRAAAARQPTFNAIGVVLFALPLLMFAERFDHPKPPLRAVRTSVEINAPPEKVWKNVVAFTELSPPDEPIFQTGIAYPIRAEISGNGVGAVRRCVFSTGAFVEPIEVWDEPNLLQFGVAAQPAVMNELSPYANIKPSHLESYLQSRKGQFLLTRLPNGNTLLEGTTWYQNDFSPDIYWGLWSDYIIHRIHQRVLGHVKLVSES
jgi:uncharacterized membrane protein YhaH (DUF805 family)